MTQSVLSAYVVFGFPGSDPWGNRPDVINAKKWQEWVCHGLRYLGYDLNTQKMTVRWPLEKRMRLATVIQVVFEDAAKRRQGASVQLLLIARVLGLTRNGGLVSPLGLYSILRLQYCVNDAVRAHFVGLPVGFDLCHDQHLLGRWWRWKRIPLAQEVWDDLRWLLKLLDLGNPMSFTWSRSIGLLIRRTPEFEMFFDASYEGIGGWCRYFHLIWRVTTDELQRLGFPVNCEEYTSADVTAAKLHINPLEFLGIIIEVWFCLVFIRRADPYGCRDWIVRIRADNTSALSWMRSAARCRHPIVRRLARFLQAMLTFNTVRLSLQDLHIPGVANKSADLLSCPLTRAPSLASAIAQAGLELEGLSAYQVPRELLLTLLEVIDDSSTAAFTAARMTSLLTLVPNFLSSG